MRTKTLLLSALLGTLGSVSLMAQSTNVYSLNAVGYINVTIPAGGADGAYSIISCPLIASPDNTITTLLNPTNGEFFHYKLFFFANGVGSYTSVNGLATKWSSATNTLAPGEAAFIFTPPGSNALTVTFVGTVPSGAMTNTLVTGYNLVSSILPTDGDLVTNTLLNLTIGENGDHAYSFSPVTQGYTSYSHNATKWNPGDPQEPTIGSGFFYYTTNVTESWVENFSVGQ